MARFGEPDGSGQPLLYSAAGDGEVRTWSLRTHRPIASVAAHPGASVLALHTLGGERLLSQGRDGFMRVWDVHNGLQGPLLELPARSLGDTYGFQAVHRLLKVYARPWLFR